MSYHCREGEWGENLVSGVLFHKERNIKDCRGILQNTKIATAHQMNSKGLKKPE